MSLKEPILWMPLSEENIAINENENIHKKQLEMLSDKTKILRWLNSAKTFWRKKTLDKLELFMNADISGTVMEVGAGTAWCSAELSKKETVDKVYALEFDYFSIEHLMPKVFDALDANKSKIHRVLGSYDDMRLEDNSLDFIVGMGAMHHSQNLLHTYKEFFRVLKPGGRVLLSDPAYSNSMSLSDELSWRETKKPNGSKNKDNGDQKFRSCQWEAYAFEAGFEVNCFIFDKTTTFNKIYSYLFGDKVIAGKQTYNGFEKIVLYPYFGKIHWKTIVKDLITFRTSVPGHDKLMLILEKPIDHKYKAMSENVYL